MICGAKHPLFTYVCCQLQEGHPVDHWNVSAFLQWDQEPQTQRLLPAAPVCECGAEKDAPSNATHYTWCAKAGLP